MPRPNDSPDVAASKTLSYLLRHGAEKESLHMRSDGYIKLTEVLARPKMRGVDVEMVLRIVAENAKQRFELFYGYDPSPPVPKAKKGEGKRKKSGMSGTRERAVPGASRNDGEQSGVSGLPEDEPLEPLKAQDGHTKSLTPAVSTGLDGSLMDAAAINDLQSDLAKSTLSAPVELPLVSLPPPNSPSPGSHNNAQVAAPCADAAHGDLSGEYFIRATQGHSLKVNDELHLEAVKNDEEGRRKVGEMVHGTKWELYETIRSHGLSRMSRQHVHLAPALTKHQITPRNGSTLLIYLDLDKVVSSGMPVFISSNGVVLTPGNAEGKVPMNLWKKVERVEKGQRRVVWEDGKDVEVPNE